MQRHTSDVDAGARGEAQVAEAPAQAGLETPGQTAIRALVRGGAPDPAQAARVLDQHPGERDELVGWLQSIFGNGFVAQAHDRPDERAAPIDLGADAVQAAVAETVSAAPVGAMAAPVGAMAAPSGPTAAPAPAAKTATDADVAELLARAPSDARGDQGYAAWLLQASELGFVEITARSKKDDTREQLEQLMSDEEWIQSRETEPGKEEVAKKKGKWKDKEGDVKREKSGVYQIRVEDAAILAALVGVASKRIQEWVDAGGGKRKPVLTLGPFVRADLGFGTSNHTWGSAIDLFGMSFSSDKDVIALLEDLEPDLVGTIVPDNNNHVHLGVEGGKYVFGLPFQGPFFQDEDRLERKQAEADEKNPEGKVTVKGLVKFHTVSKSERVLDEKTGTWKWTKSKPTGASAKSYLKSKPLQKAFDKLNETGESAKLHDDEESETPKHREIDL